MFRLSPSFICKALLTPLALGLWAGCVTPAVTIEPEMRESIYLTTFESGFRISPREGVIRYTVTLETGAPLEHPLFLDVRYQNPENPDQPFTESLDISPGEERIFLKSPPLKGLETGAVYRIEIDVFNDPERTEARDGHDILLISTIETRN